MNKWDVITALRQEENENKRGRYRADYILEMLEQADAPNTQELTDEDATRYYSQHVATKRKECYQ